MRHVLRVCCTGIVLASCGCSRTPTVDENAESLKARESGAKGSNIPAELARKDAELAAARAQVEELRRLLAEQSRPVVGDPSADPIESLAPMGRSGLSLVASVRVHEGAIAGVAFAPDGKTVASTDTLGRIVISEVEELKQVRSVEAATGVGVQNTAHSVCFAPDGRHFAVGSADRSVWIWRSADGKLVKRVRGHRDAVDYVSFLPDSRSGLSFDRQGVGLAWAIDEERRELVPDRRIRKAALTPDGKMLVWSDGSQTLFGPPSQATPIATLGTFADALAVSADGGSVAKGSNTFCVEVWDSLTATKRWAGTPMPGRVHALAFTADRKRLVSLAAGALSVWDVRTGDEKHRFRIRSEVGTCKMAVAADGRTLAVGNWQGVLTVVRLGE